MRDRQCGVPYYWKRYVFCTKEDSIIMQFLKCIYAALFASVVCLFCCIERKGVDTAFWSCSKKFIFESFRNLCWCSFVSSSFFLHKHIFLPKHSIPQHLCKLLSIWLHFLSVIKALHIFRRNMFSRRSIFASGGAANWFKSHFFRPFPFVFLC